LVEEAASPLVLGAATWPFASADFAATSTPRPFAFLLAIPGRFVRLAANQLPPAGGVLSRVNL
jgi:hypothetical protein